MKTRNMCLRWVKLFPIAAILAVTPASSGPEAGPVGFPDDWSHRHVVFSNPGTLAEALRSGTYAHWVRTVNASRFILQQQKRAAATRPVAVAPSRALGAELEAQTVERESPEEGGALADSPMQENLSAAQAADQREGRMPLPPRRRVRRRSLQTDWSEDLGTGATLGMGVYPAKFSFNISSASCASDYVVYGTSLAGSGTQASIVGFSNLYTGCGGTVPTVNWAYNTSGGTVATSVTLSLDGTQVAFVQSSASVASLAVLKWKAGEGTLAAPATPTTTTTTPATYATCRAGATSCLLTLTFSGGKDDTGSAPFYDYGSDVLYVGDDGGTLHKFTGIFKGTPAEVTTSPWPVSVSVHANGLSSPVINSNTGDVLVGDYQAVSEPNCGLGCGFFYRVSSSTGTVVQSAKLEFGFGIVDAPLLDQAAGTVYVFAGADSNVNTMTPPCGGHFVSCSGVIQLSATFSAGASGTEETLGFGNDFMYSGAFDNQYFTSANHASPTGHLYALGNTNGDVTLYQIPITANVMGSATTGPVISSNMSAGSVLSPAMPVTEIFTGTHDYIFTSALYFGQPMILADCGGGSLMIGCVMGFDVTSGTISGATTPTAATPSTGGVSGIIIDNFATTPGGTSNIYYSTLGNQACPTSGGTGGCAIQVSQSTP